MKKLIFLMFGALCLLIASCSKDSGFYPGLDSSLALSRGYPAHGPVVVVPPNKDGDDDGDTDDLMNAINSAEPGTIIKLTEGTYKVGFLEILGFKGQIAGAGRDKTLISPDGQIEVIPQQAQPPAGLNLLPTWWRIIGGDVTISDLTFKTGDGVLISDLDEAYGKTLASLIVVNNYYEYFEKDDPQPMNFTIKNVNMVCGKIEPVEDSYLGAGYNVLMPLWMGMPYWWPPVEGIDLTKGSYNVINCYFENGFDGFEFFSLGEEATGTADRIVTNGCGYGIYCTANFNSRISITNSTFRNSVWYDVFIEDNDWGLVGGDIAYKRCQYLLAGNTFNVSPGIQSVVFQDGRNIMYPDFNSEPTLAMIKNNVFNLKEGSSGISLLNNSDGQVRNNRFTGSGNTGVYVDGADIYNIWVNPPEFIAKGISKDALILGNNFTGLTPATADIVLGENSMNCTVVGNGKESIVDNGTGNKIVGMKKHTGGYHAGPTIRDNFRMWHGMRHR